MEIISKRLKMLREEAGLSQSKIGQLIGVPQSSVYRYEQDNLHRHRRHSVGMLITSDVSLDYIYGRTDDPHMELIMSVFQNIKPLLPIWKSLLRCALTQIQE